MKSKIILLCVLIASAAVPAFTLDIGDSAPPFVLTDLDRDYVFSRDSYGKGWVLVDFFATWCDNCKKELPHLENIITEYEDAGFSAFLISADEDGHSAVKPYFSQNPTVFKVLVDKYKKSLEAFGVSALPSVFLIDPDGNIAFTSVGYHPEDIDAIKAILSEAYGN